MDTRVSQEALEYQMESFDQYIERIKRNNRFKRGFMKLIAPLASRALIKRSPYLIK
ncbi:MAG: hypothetical protein JW891_03920 [Candidatus Lokiarchaeota archaeon]|nr:hypothetical protein [Candidatus Lokiarchaeota archaeon]